MGVVSRDEELDDLMIIFILTASIFATYLEACRDSIFCYS